MSKFASKDEYYLSKIRELQAKCDRLEAEEQRLDEIVCNDLVIITRLEAQLAELNSPVQLSEWQNMEQQLAELEAENKALKQSLSVQYSREGTTDFYGRPFQYWFELEDKNEELRKENQELRLQLITELVPDGYDTKPRNPGVDT